MNKNDFQTNSIISCLLFLSVIIVYCFSFNSEFVNIDDPSYIYLNKAIIDKDFTLALSTLTVGDWTPVVTISHILESYLSGGISPQCSHIVSIVFHALNTILIFVFCSYFKLDKKHSILISLIFAFHPLQVESVSWVASRKNLLSTFFGLSFCLLALKGKYKSSIASLLLALMSKGISVIFPVWYLILAYFRAVDLKKEKYFLSLCFFLAAIRAAMSIVFQKGVIESRPVGQMDFLERFNIFSQVLVVQIRQFFLPFDLSLRYFWKSSYGIEFFLSLLVIALFTFLSTYYWKKQRVLSLCLALFFVTLLPTSNLISAPDFQADRYFYLAIFPFSVFMLHLITRFSSKMDFVFYFWIALILLPNNFYRQQVWSNSERLWQNVLERYPNYAFGWNQLSLYYLEKKALPNAETALRKTLLLEPKNLYARYNLGLLLKNTNRKQEALPYLQSLVGTKIEQRFPIKKILETLQSTSPP